MTSNTNIQNEIFDLQKRIISNIGFCLYPMEDFCLMNYILNTLQVQKEVKVEAISKRFTNSDKILDSLKGSKMFIQNDIKGGSKMFEINQDFFIILSGVITDIQNFLALEKKKMEENSGKVECKSCGKKRQKYTVGFIRCDCQSNEVIETKTDNSEKLEEIGLMQELVNRVSQWKAQLDLKKKQQAAQKQALENNDTVSYEVTDIKEVMKNVQKQLEELKKKNPEYSTKPIWIDQLKNNGYYIKMARQQYRPKRKYSKIKEMEQVRKRRKTQNSR